MPVGDELAIAGLSGLRLIGRGRFSTVYRGREDRLGRDVAVKVLQVDLSDPQVRYQFLNGCAAAGRIGDHPNIVTVYNSGVTVNGEPYLVMELCEQGSLADRLRGGPLDVPAALAILVKLCDALTTAHQADILHSDVKPENILFTNSGEPALADFGVGTLIGQPGPAANHAAPEVLGGARATAASDVYSLASTGYQLLAGVPPFQRGHDESRSAFITGVAQPPAPPLARADAPPSLVQAIARGLATDPDQRYATAAEFGHDLSRIQPEAVAAAVIPPPAPPAAPVAPSDDSVTMLQPGLRPTAPPPPAPQPPARRRPWLVPVAGAFALFLLLCGGGGYLGYQRFLADSPQTSLTGSPTPGDRSSAAAPTAEPADSPTAAPTEAPTAAETRSATPPPPPPAQQTTKTQNTPTGPYVVYLRVKQQPRCPSGTTTNRIPGTDVVLEWKVSGGATGSTLSVDGPGIYGEYGVSETLSLAFPCGDWSPDNKTATHTYMVTTLGGGPSTSRTITVTATVNEIASA